MPASQQTLDPQWRPFKPIRGLFMAAVIRFFSLLGIASVATYLGLFPPGWNLVSIGLAGAVIYWAVPSAFHSRYSGYRVELRNIDGVVLPVTFARAWRAIVHGMRHSGGGWGKTVTEEQQYPPMFEHPVGGEFFVTFVRDGESATLPSAGAPTVVSIAPAAAPQAPADKKTPQTPVDKKKLSEQQQLDERYSRPAKRRSGGRGRSDLEGLE